MYSLFIQVNTLNALNDMNWDWNMLPSKFKERGPSKIMQQIMMGIATQHNLVDSPHTVLLGHFYWAAFDCRGTVGWGWWGSGLGVHNPDSPLISLFSFIFFFKI